ncbi:Helix-loop-helix DNA-binding domain family protein [Acanthocheilonema viteae]|uniref:BHLH domain-containing protein n=1 Tax=Acanthocheilonema viteae TaxID=6277 RepID=A0A498SBG4_ACAVI|nr:unnamed protein product [Acanthocheilonema viteae]
MAATIQTIRLKTTKTARWSRRRRERKQVLEELRKMVPFVNEHTPLLELLQKVIDYITELQELLNNSSMDAVQSKENVSPWRTNEPGCKIYTYPCAYYSSPYTE